VGGFIFFRGKVHQPSQFLALVSEPFSRGLLIRRFFFALLSRWLPFVPRITPPLSSGGLVLRDPFNSTPHVFRRSSGGGFILEYTLLLIVRSFPSFPQLGFDRFLNSSSFYQMFKSLLRGSVRGGSFLSVSLFAF